MYSYRIDQIRRQLRRGLGDHQDTRTLYEQVDELVDVVADMAVDLENIKEQLRTRERPD
jgi:hypothetical protein